MVRNVDSVISFASSKTDIKNFNFTNSDLIIIFGPPGVGKTSLMVALANLFVFSRERNKLMQNEISRKNTLGFSLSIPCHTVSANFDIIAKKFRCSSRTIRRINPYRLGFANEYVDVHFNLPYESIFITEAQKYFNSRLSKYFPVWQSRWFEMHRHNNISVFMDTQRPMLIDVNIRDISKFWEVVKINVLYDYKGRVVGVSWNIRVIDNSSLFDKYMASGKLDSSCFKEIIFSVDFNVFKLYDSQSCKPRFYDGHFDSDFDLKFTDVVDESFDGYLKYLLENDDELPDGYYQKKSGN